MREPTATVACSIWRRHGATDGTRIIPEETAIAFTYEGGSYAVMMATPQNLEDFAVGFSVTEGLAASPADIRQLDIVEHAAGIELRMWLTEPRAAALNERRRHLAGPTGCGLCGIESLDEAVRTPPRVPPRAIPLRRPRSCARSRRWRLARSSIAKRERSMPRPSGSPAAASSPFARTSDDTTRSTSWSAR